ncbi:Signal transduction histidine kinase [Actinacidiphila yanglinensis]|uniref:histidine kinase n=1 Tax=Actinacidiphila yanglinensis TaxID=310779 RepID=A0A1H5VQK7_9ACTN|nr:ATP-binding protein [Actinacidiphila yanglinensis]SEF89453.1 Signal transduction histidine kinase [Actinacidiphila yanglinensis]
MSTLIQEAAAALLLVVALAACGAAVRFRRIAHARQRQVEQQHAQNQATLLAEQERVRQLADRQRALEDALGYLASTGLAEAAAAALEPGEGREVEFVLPQPLNGTPAAQRIEELVAGHTALVRQTRRDTQAAADRQVEQAHDDARDATRAAVLTFASALVNLGAELADQVSVGVRRHHSDEAYATLMEIDHTSQQMLRVAQGYMVLAGGTLGRRLPATEFTDIARAAMGRIQNYERVRAQELDQAVVPRAVEALVHTLAILLDNAVRYAPPTSYAEVSFRTGHNGVTMLVDDAGLQMSPEQLERAREILTGKQPLDIHALGAYPQTGFRVAAQLAARYGFRIDLEAPNLFGGTRALVFVPAALLTSAPVVQAGHVPAPGSEQAYGPGQGYAAGPQGYPGDSGHSGQAAPSAQPVRTAQEPQPWTALPAYGHEGREDGPHHARQDGPAPAGQPTTASGLTRRRRRPQTAAPAPAAPVGEARPGRPDIAAAWADGTRRGRAPSAPAAAEGWSAAGAERAPQDATDHGNGSGRPGTSGAPDVQENTSATSKGDS